MILSLEIPGPELTSGLGNTSTVCQEARAGAAVEAEVPEGIEANQLIGLFPDHHLNLLLSQPELDQGRGHCPDLDQNQCQDRHLLIRQGLAVAKCDAHSFKPAGMLRVF